MTPSLSRLRGLGGGAFKACLWGGGNFFQPLTILIFLLWFSGCSCNSKGNDYFCANRLGGGGTNIFTYLLAPLQVVINEQSLNYGSGMSLTHTFWEIMFYNLVCNETNEQPSIWHRWTRKCKFKRLISYLLSSILCPNFMLWTNIFHTNIGCMPHKWMPPFLVWKSG